MISPAVCLPQAARAAQVFVTITGTVTDGYDMTGVFGKPNTDLKDQPFTVIFTFDDTKGKQQVLTCSPDNSAPAYYSSIGGSGASSPGTAVLQIAGRSFPIGAGALDQTVIGSYALRYVVTPCSSESAAGFGVKVVYGENSSSRQISGISWVGPDGAATVFPAPGTELSTNYDWRAPINAASLAPGSTFSFVVEVQTFGNPLGNTFLYYANGNLIASTLTVSGPESSQPVCAGPAPSVVTAGGDNRQAKRPSPPKPPARPTPHGPVQVTIDTSAAGKQPNLLQLGDTTIVNVSVSPPKS
jgi:hypothetical protein